jgi:hypothetical protein
VLLGDAPGQPGERAVSDANVKRVLGNEHGGIP